MTMIKRRAFIFSAVAVAFASPAALISKISSGPRELNPELLSGDYRTSGYQPSRPIRLWADGVEVLGVYAFNVRESWVEFYHLRNDDPNELPIIENGECKRGRFEGVKIEVHYDGYWKS